MKKITAVLLLVVLAAAPSLAGLKFVATPLSVSYDSIGGDAGSLALSVDLVSPPSSDSIQFVTGPSLSATPISLLFVPQAGATGPAPLITDTSTNAADGWNPVIPPTATTFTAFNFSPAGLTDPGDLSQLVGQAHFNVTDPTTNGRFDLMVTAFALDGVDMPSQAIGTIRVVGICQPNTGDFDGNGRVEFADFLILSSNFGGAGGVSEGDADCNERIEFADFLILSSNFGTDVAAAAVPEPNALIWLPVSFAAMLEIGRRR